MILRYVCWSFFLCLALGPIVNSQVTVDDQGYQNVFISIAPNVPSKDGQVLIRSIQDLLENTSSVLHTAIGIRIASATILLPPSWPTNAWKDITVNPASPVQTAKKTDILVDGTEDSPFRNQPVSLQYGGCGVEGHQIILTRDFISEAEKYPKGKLLAREWLKYRYGVFEENGFNQDKLYPPFYRILGSPELKLTECTDSKVAYTFRNPNGISCYMDTSYDLDLCRTDVDKKSGANVTSSLMYFHKDLPEMTHICGKEGLPHHSTARNKQNTLCNGRSIWDVVKSSQDFKKSLNQSANPVPIQFSYIQENRPNFVVLLENSDHLYEKENPIKFALRRLYYDLPPKSNLAIYTFNSDVKGALPFAELPAKGRTDLGVIADFLSPAKSVCTSCGLVKATEILVPNEVKKASVLLITASPLDKIPELSPKLRDSGICLHLLRFTGEQNPEDQSYDSLARSFYCFSQKSLSSDSDSATTLNVLTEFLKHDVEEFDDNFAIQTVASGIISAKDLVTIPRDAMASLYTLWLGKALESSSIECKAGDKAVILKTNATATDIASFTFDPIDGDVTCKLGSTKSGPILSQVQKTARRVPNLVFDTWIHDRSTDKEQLPILIYVKIYFDGYPVKDANVTTVVKLGNNQETVNMIDNGRGDPDVTQYDGIYSGYFSSFWEAGHYQIAVKIDDNGGLAKAGKELKSSEPIACCGSKIMSTDTDVPAFNMQRVIVFTAKNKRPKDGYPPSRIIDLGVFRVFSKIVLNWSAPGGGKAARYILKLFENRDDAVVKFDTAGRELNASSMVPKDTGKLEGFVIYIQDLVEDMHYYATIRSVNEFGKQSEISNVLEFIAKQNSTIEYSTTTSSNSTEDGSTPGGDLTDPNKSNSNTVAIVLGVLGGLVVVAAIGFLVYHFFIRKPRRN